MKKVLVLIFIVGWLDTSAQETEADSVSFCQRLFPIPASCATSSKSQIFCDDYSMYWFYLDKAMIPFTFKITVDGLVKGIGNCKKDSVNIFLLNQKVPTIKLTCMVNGVPHYEFVSCGIVDDQAVINTLILLKNPKINDDLPLPIRKIVRLK